MIKITFRYGYGPDYTVRPRSARFKKLFEKKLARNYRKSISGYRATAL